MLETIKQAVEELPNETFGEYYQKYVMQSQDSIIQHDVSFAGHQYHSLEDIPQLMQGLNTLSEELKRL